MMRKLIAAWLVLCAALALFGGGAGVPRFKITQPAHAQTTKPCADNCNGTTFSGGGCSATLSLDGSGIGTYEGSNSVAITTTKNNDIVLVFVGFGDGTAPTATGLSFSRRSGAPFASNQIDYYWAVVATAGTYTINTNQTGNSAIDAIGIAGANTRSPFDTSVARGATSVTITTSNANDFIIGFAATSGSVTAGSGFTLIDGGSATFLGVEYDIVPTIQPGLNVTFSPTGMFAVFADAIKRSC